MVSGGSFFPLTGGVPVGGLAYCGAWRRRHRLLPLGEEELHLEPERGVGAVVGADGVVEGLDRAVDGLLADAE